VRPERTITGPLLTVYEEEVPDGHDEITSPVDVQDVAKTIAGRRTPPTHSIFASHDICPLRLLGGDSSGVVYFPLSTAKGIMLPGGQ